MKTNGVVRRLVSSPGLERWEAQCLLCSWGSGGRRLYASKNAAERTPRAVKASLRASGTRFTPEKSSE